MRNDADIAPRVRGMRDHVDAGDAHLAGGGQRTRGADADSGRFAGAVGAEQAEDLALVDGEVDAIDGDYALFALVNFGQAGDFDDHLGGRPFRGMGNGFKEIIRADNVKITANA